MEIFLKLVKNYFLILTLGILKLFSDGMLIFDPYSASKTDNFRIECRTK